MHRKADEATNSGRLMSLEKSPRRVLYVEYGIGFGGSIVSLSELARSLQATGLVSPLLVTSQEQRVVDAVVKDLPHKHFRRLLSYRTRASITSSVRSGILKKLFLRPVSKALALSDWMLERLNSYRLVRVAKNHQAHLIHVNNGWHDEAVRAAYLAGLPCIVHCRGIYSSPIIKSLWRRRRLEDTVVRFIAISGVVADGLVSGGIPRGRITIIDNPVDVPRYAEGRFHRCDTRNRLGFSPDDIVVSIFGRVTRWKGQLEFLRAMAQIVPNCSRLKIMIVGDPSDAKNYHYVDRVHAFSNEMLSGRVVFSGYKADVEKYYWASDIVVHNSQSAEPFGRVVIEAMACERAVVAVDEGGPSEIISNGVDGVLTPPRDIEALGRTVEKLYRSSQRRLELGGCALMTAQRRFSSQAIAAQVLSLYNEVEGSKNMVDTVDGMID